MVAILAHDVEFWRYLPRLHPHRDATGWFKHALAVARDTAYRNGTLQAAYFIVAVRALGADIGAVSGFDMAAVQAAFFAGTTLEANFICNIGYGDPVNLMPRLPGLRFEEIVHKVCMRCVAWRRPNTVSSHLRSVSKHAGPRFIAASRPGAPQGYHRRLQTVQNHLP